MYIIIMNIIYKLNEDLLIKILEIYINKYIICKKKDKEIEDIFINKYIYELIKRNVLCKIRCNILEIKEIKYKVCMIHDKVNLDMIKSIVIQIKNIKNNNAPIIYHNNNENVNMMGNSRNIGHIHYNKLEKSKKIVEKIIKKFGYKLINYCCNGNGCKINKIN